VPTNEDADADAGGDCDGDDGSEQQALSDSAADPAIPTTPYCNITFPVASLHHTMPTDEYSILCLLSVGSDASDQDADRDNRGDSDDLEDEGLVSVSVFILLAPTHRKRQAMIVVVSSVWS
jgi:hypothetical protein